MQKQADFHKKYCSALRKGHLCKPTILDEFPEFERRVIEALRQPLEDRVISVARAKGTAHFPARFALVAAMNPCPCGNWGHPEVACTCPPGALEKYRRKISGPIADRIDLWSVMGPVELGQLRLRNKTGSETAEARKKVLQARAAQKRRFNKEKTNADMSGRDIDELVPLRAPVRSTLERAGERLSLSPRAYHRVIKVARTIADLDEEAEVIEPHILEALQYREKKQ